MGITTRSSSKKTTITRLSSRTRTPTPSTSTGTAFSDPSSTASTTSSLPQKKTASAKFHSAKVWEKITRQQDKLTPEEVDVLLPLFVHKQKWTLQECEDSGVMDKMPVHNDVRKMFNFLDNKYRALRKARTHNPNIVPVLMVRPPVPGMLPEYYSSREIGSCLSSLPSGVVSSQLAGAKYELEFRDSSAEPAPEPFPDGRGLATLCRAGLLDGCLSGVV